MATFVMQALGMDVAAMNTVHFSKLLSFVSHLSDSVGFHSVMDETGRQPCWAESQLED